jgi:hypothetical protein
MSVPTAERFSNEDDPTGPGFVGNVGDLEFDPYSRPRTEVIGDLALYGVERQPDDLIPVPWWKSMVLEDGELDPLGEWADETREPWEKNTGVARFRYRNDSEVDPEL